MIFKKLQQFKQIITYMVVCWTIIISKTITRLSKQQVLDADPKAIQQINFIENLDQGAGEIMFFIIEEGKETVLDFSQETIKLF